MTMTMHKRRAPSKPSGLSLVELLVALAIGLFLIAGVGTVFVSNQTSTKTKQELDHIQENFRFGANTLQRVLRQASEIDAASNATTLIVTLPEGAHNCMGTTVAAGGQTNQFSRNGTTLECEIILNDGTTSTQVLFSGLSGLSFAYGTDGAAAPESATSVQVTLTMPGLQVPGVADAPAPQEVKFFAALRAKLVADFGAPSGGGTPGAPSAGAPAPSLPAGNNQAENPAGAGTPQDAGDNIVDTPSVVPSPSEGGAPSGQATPFSCNCKYKNNPGWTVEGGSDQRCTKTCCQNYDTGSGNNRVFSITVSSCS